MKNILIMLSISAGALLLSGCYLVQQGFSLMTHHLSARPVERVFADPTVSEGTRDFLRLVEEILEFSAEQLGLDASRNYTRYVEIDRNYLAAVVNATEELSFRDYTWKYPIVGEVPYKGFFHPRHARREAERLREDGYDPWISAVTAFSTLGYLRDPLYSFMKEYSTYRLADLIIHELTHATLWVKDEARFNEEIATFIGNRGAEQFVKNRYGEQSPQYQEIFERREDRKQFTHDILMLKEKLETLYRQDITDEEKREKKGHTIVEFQETFQKTYESSYQTDRYAGFADIEVNNAYISINSVYHTADDIYQRLYEHTGSCLKTMIDLVRPLDGTRKDPYAYMEQLLREEQQHR